MADWFYGKDNAQHGPISDLEIRSLISTGQIDPTTIIWREGMKEWSPLKDVSEFHPAGGTANPYTSPQTITSAQRHTPPTPTDPLAITSMVLGIISILASCMYIGIIFGIPAVICGHLSIKKITRASVTTGGKGMAIAGLITGYIGSFISLCLIGLITTAMILG